jgi:hypothetical protein
MDLKIWINKEKKGKDKKKNDKYDEDDEGKYRNFILNMLKEKEVLLILDNAEDPLEDDNIKFVEELASIIDNCIHVKFLVTTRKTINKLPHNHEKPYILHPLSKESSLKLLISKAPRNISREELQDLLNFNLNPRPEQEDERNLLNHPFTEMLGGHPQAISLAAPLLEYKSLKELYSAFCDSNIMDALEIQK